MLKYRECFIIILLILLAAFCVTQMASCADRGSQEAKAGRDYFRNNGYHQARYWWGAAWEKIPEKGGEE